VDALADLLDGVRARAALLTRTALPPGWSVRFASGAELTIVSMVRGRAWVAAGERVTEIAPGDVAVVRGPEPHTVSEDPEVPASRVITDDDYCERSRADARDARTCGDPGSGTLLLSGAYERRAGIGERLLDALPRVLVVPGAESRHPAPGLVAAEVAEERPGQRAVLDRLLDLLLVATLRAWFDRPGADVPAWYRPAADPAVAEALRRLHDDPAHPWTVARLAATTGLSRAALARRFSAEVGEPPMTHLAGVRIALAADLLRESDATVDSIARKVGYANAFALSVAFKRRRGATPTEHRATGHRRAG
jgi:AraC-like DNA-binding protein